MTTTAPHHRAPTAAPGLGRAELFVDGLTAQDFGRLADSLAADVCFRALLPRGLRECNGAEAVASLFAAWFADTEAFEAIEAGADDISGRLHVHWRLRLRARRLGDGWFTVDQQAYADTDDDGRIARLDLLCTGYLAEDCDD